MKKITILLLLAVFALPSMAQSPINLGLKGGYSNSKLTADIGGEGSVDNYHVGAFVRLNLGRLYLQPEAYFSSKGGTVDFESGASHTIHSFDLKTVDVPILLGVNVIDKGPLKVRANAGPLMSFFTDKELNNEFFDSNDVKDSFFGWQYGVGADFLFLTLDVRMENSSGDLYSGPLLDNDVKSKSFVVSLGIKLL
ncbi:porin family protein [Sunxiuqinia elliptica]|uniref:Opacity protein-like surface antigen n=1 Tax=Sunxiuqinia elliptica TaxID=655355 RepID=A0A4R6GYJ7_9BACT|nr:porin family protein [Sunxiuqinia elliptica]TDN99924.1 opacity protein-like surface antigen [Sunxiuqinia elliptica]TDO57116.1 opacity protein-like surface antigen [Sunxiuqinia elliptica]